MKEGGEGDREAEVEQRGVRKLMGGGVARWGWVGCEEAWGWGSKWTIGDEDDTRTIGRGHGV